MAMTHNSATLFVTSGVETSATLGAYITANGLGTVGGAAMIVNRYINISTGATLTIDNGGILDFLGNYRMQGSGTLNLEEGSTLRYNGVVNHSFFNLEFNPTNAIYDSGLGAGRVDFFAPGTKATSTLTNLTIIYRGTGSNHTRFTHLEALAGRINGLNLINKHTGTGTPVYIQFGNGTYTGVSLPEVGSNVSMFLARSGGSTLGVDWKTYVANLVFSGNVSTASFLQNTRWVGTADADRAFSWGSYNQGNKRIYAINTLGLSANTGAEVRIVDAQSNVQIEKTIDDTTENLIEMSLCNSALTESASYASGHTTPSGLTKYNPYTVRMRAGGKLPTEQVITSYGHVELAVPLENDPLYQAGVTGITVDQSTSTITLTAVKTADELWSALVDWSVSDLSRDIFYQQNGLTLDLADWTLTGAGVDRTDNFSFLTTTATANTDGTIGVFDANGDSFLSFTGVAAWTVYASEADANTSSNALATGTVTDTYRFIFSGATAYYLRMAAGGGSVIQQQVSVSQSGETVVSLDTKGLLLSLSGDVSQARDHARSANIQTKRIA